MTLDALALKHGTDKASNHHNYCHTYERYLLPFRDRLFTFIEAGIGGYHYPDRGGHSARMWREYFRNARVVTFDVYDKQLPDFTGIEVHKGSQDDEGFLTDLIQQVGAPTVFVDDGSHLNQHQIRTFEIVFPLMPSGGIYICEDVETSYWNDHGFDGSPDFADLTTKTALNYFRKLVNDVMYEHIREYPRKFEIKAIHFYDNTVIIEKL